MTMMTTGPGTPANEASFGSMVGSCSTRASASASGGKPCSGISTTE
jgi:hypothetical protein